MGAVQGDEPVVEAEDLAASALTESGCAFDPNRLAAFVTGAERVALRAGRLSEQELSRSRNDGFWAAESGVRLPALVDAYLSAARMLWLRLADRSDVVGRGDLAAVGAALFRAVDDALAQVAAGYAQGRRTMLRQDEARRRDFIEDLLLGSGGTASLLARAEQYGLVPAAWHSVVVLGATDAAHEAQTAASDVESTIRSRLPGRGLLVAARRGRLVVVIQAGSPDHARAPEIADIGPALLRAAGRVAEDPDDAVVSVSRPRQGTGGIAAGFQEAADGFTLVGALGWRGRVVYADELAVFRVLLRDRESMIELVESVLGPLRSARGGARPLVETLYTFYSTGAVATESARRLHLSVRAVTYRLGRVRELTGYDPVDVGHRLTLHVAVTGARLLQWEGAGGPAVGTPR